MNLKTYEAIDQLVLSLYQRIESEEREAAAKKLLHEGLYPGHAFLPSQYETITALRLVIKGWQSMQDKITVC